MKRILIVIAALFAMSAASAQNQKYAFVNIESIFTSMPQYEPIMQELNEISAKYQTEIQAEYTRAAEMYDRYQYQKQNLTEPSRKKVEDNIIAIEKKAGELQEKYFGQEGDMMKLQNEKMKPLRDKISESIGSLAQQEGYDMIIDLSSNPSIVFYNKNLDVSDRIKSMLGIRK